MKGAALCAIADIMEAPAPLLIERLEAIKPAKLSWNAWANLASVNRSVFQDARKRNNLTMDTLDRLLSAIGVSLGDFEAGAPIAESIKEPSIDEVLSSTTSHREGNLGSYDPVKVLGTAIGHEHQFDADGAMIYVEMTEIDLAETVNYIQRPSAIALRKDIYALYVAGTSMQPRYDPGDPIFVDPHQHPSMHDDVIVQLRDEMSDHVICALIKTLVKRSGSYIDLQQYNPPRIFRIPMERVARIQRVIPRSELHR